MLYRIRYALRGRNAEADVEAHTPTEAMVKFRHTQRAVGDRASESVISVAAVLADPMDASGIVAADLLAWM